ncbi:MAG TPA: bifunctional DNA primase/polymerase [Chloroflexota bacterium]|nr:bifunctional DNA primase/polymerase [Chloroflexota bacterium]HUM68918.1 bifunctional DNA primase/polymerase [Chloroflexota bacterium]
MANKKALRLIELRLHPVLLGNEGEDLKRPLLKGWQTAVYTAADVRTWPPQNNIGIRCGLQRSLPRASRGGRSLIVFDFDGEATRVYPAWRWGVAQCFRQPVVTVVSARGYHVYFFTSEAHAGQTLAGRYVQTLGEANGRKRLFKFIETLGTGRQVVAAGCRHPSGHRYQFTPGAGYGDISILTAGEYQALVALSKSFDERPSQPERKLTARPVRLSGELSGIRNCLDYARRFIGAAEQEERNGDIRFLGQGGLLVTADGRGWYSFSEETGGGLAELIAWHQSLLIGEG